MKIKFNYNDKVKCEVLFKLIIFFFEKRNENSLIITNCKQFNVKIAPKLIQCMLNF